MYLVLGSKRLKEGQQLYDIHVCDKQSDVTEYALSRQEQT